MKMLLLTPLVFWLSMTAMAQPTNARGWYNSKDLEGTPIGWLQVISFKEPLKPFSRNGRNYPVSQLEFAKNTVQWWQGSYHPVGLLGEMKQSVLAADLGSPMTDRSWGLSDMEKDNRRALPNTYGAFAKMHKCLVKNEKYKFYPMPGNHCDMSWDIMANNLELITRQVIAISSPDDYYCIQPRYTPGMKGQYDKDWLAVEADYRGFQNHPNLKKYDHYYIPAGAPIGNGAGYYTVVMTKDRQPLPFETVTVSEFLQRLEKALPLLYANEVNKTKNNPPDYMKTVMPDAQRGLQYLKATYKTRMNAQVFFTNAAIDITILDLAWAEPGKDFNSLVTAPTITNKTGYTETAFPLLHLKKGVKEACATSDPQWIVFRLAGMLDKSYGGCVDLMEQFTARFKYDHYYDYYFGGKKSGSYANVGGVASKTAETVSTVTVAKPAADNSTLFFADFSHTTTGSTPADWKLQRNNAGNFPVVVEIPGAAGKWLKLQRFAYPVHFPASISGDFLFSIDLLVRKGDVPWGTPGIQVDFYSAGTPNADGSISARYRFGIDVSPGDMNRKDAAGWVMMSMVMPEGYSTCKRENYYSLPDFTGSKEVNKVTMSIERKGEKVVVLCNNQKVFACEKAIPKDLPFNAFRLFVNEKNVYHIGQLHLQKN